MHSVIILLYLYSGYASSGFRLSSTDLTMYTNSEAPNGAHAFKIAESKEIAQVWNDLKSKSLALITSSSVCLSLLWKLNLLQIYLQ